MTDRHVIALLRAGRADHRRRGALRPAARASRADQRSVARRPIRATRRARRGSSRPAPTASRSTRSMPRRSSSSPTQGTVDLQQVQLGFRDSDGNQWTARGTHGELAQDTGIVRARRRGARRRARCPGTKEPAEITTEHLTFDTTRRSSRRTIRSRSCWPDGSCRRTGMVANLKEQSRAVRIGRAWLFPAVSLCAARLRAALLRRAAPLALRPPRRPLPQRHSRSRSMRRPPRSTTRRNTLVFTQRRHHPGRHPCAGRSCPRHRPGDFANSRWTFEGNVHIDAEQQGNLRSDAAVVEFRTITSRAPPSPASRREFEQKRDRLDQVARGHADEIVYDVTAGTVRLTKDAWLSDGQNEISGPLLVYNIRAQRVQAATAPGTGSACTSHRSQAMHAAKPASPRSRPRTPPSHDGPQSHRPGQELQVAPGGARPVARARQRRGGGTARTQWRRQDHRLLHDRGTGARAMPVASTSATPT